MDSKSSTPITPPTPPRSEPSTPSILSRADSKRNRRQIGWAPPSLKIPSPQGFPPPTPVPMSSRGNYTANISMQGLSPNVQQNPYVYPRKYSEYVFSQFNGIKDFTIGTAKSGLGIGEKCSFWLYNKLSKLSRSWFTHIFLTIVIVLYTVGGAFIFLTVEGTSRTLQDGDLRKERYAVVEDIMKMAETIPEERTEGEFYGAATSRLDEYENFVIDVYKQNTLVKDRKWTFWNAVFFCSTIYTTIASFPTMDAAETSADTDELKPCENVENGDQKIANLESLVTPEQVHSASVARRRRNITRRRSSSANRRDPTPVRLVEIDHNHEYRERPKTPERRRKRIVNKEEANEIGVQESSDEKVKENDEKSAESHEETKDVDGETKDIRDEKNENEESAKCDEVQIQKNEAKTTTEQPLATKTKQDIKEIEAKIESIINLSQTELVAMFDKAKQKIKSSRDKYRKKEVVKRSQSAPRHLTDEELMESFKRAQMASAERENQRKRSSSVRKYSTDSSSSDMIPKAIPKPVPRIPKVSKIPKQQTSAVIGRKRFDQRPACNKIIEILDPKTSKVIKTKEIVYIKFNFIQFLKMVKVFSIKDIVMEYRIFKVDMKHEHAQILNMRRKCLNELLLMMVLCGLGGVVFKFVEGAFENFYKCGVKRIKRDFIDQLWMKSHNLREEDWKSLARNKLKHFEEELHLAHEAGIRSYTGKTSWSFLNGVVYSLSLVTTIGYGHMFPTTLTGKGLTILYALIGIPLFLIILTDFGKLFTRCIKFVWAFVRRLYYTGRCRTVRRTTHVAEIFKGAQMVYEAATQRRPSRAADPEVQVEEDADDGGTSPATPAPSNYEINDEFNLPITLALSILVMYIFLGAVGFQILEDWDFFSSFYFVFISLSTIGLGDFVPSNHIFMILSIIYLVFGLALMSMCINVVQDKLSDTFKRASAKLGATIGFTVNEEDGSITTVPPDQVEMPEVHGNNMEISQKDINKNGDNNTEEILKTEIK